MRLKILLSGIFLLSTSIVYADAQVKISQQLCEKRIAAFKSGLESAIAAKQNVEATQAELDQINKLPSTLSPCEKQKRIPALSNSDEAEKQASETLTDRKISP